MIEKNDIINDIITLEVDESIQTGESRMEKAWASSSCINLSGLIFLSISVAPFRQNTLPCCYIVKKLVKSGKCQNQRISWFTCPAAETAAILDRSTPWILIFSIKRSNALTHMIVGAVTLPFSPLWTPKVVRYSLRSWSNWTCSELTTFRLSSIITALI